jgi:hypothetical protein
MKTSIDLAKERGAFPAIEGSIYDPENLKWEPPTPLKPYARNWDRPSLDWEKIVTRIKKHGIRNGAQCTVAPTGTIATVSGCEAYGCEPVFALAYIRHVNDKGQDLQLQYTSPALQQALEKAGLSADQIKRIVEQVNLEGTCQNIPDLPESIRHTFVVSSDITAEEHIYMQAAMQRFIDNAISKCVTGDTLILTPNGLVPIEELSEMRLPDQFENMTMDVITPYGVEKTDAFFYGGKRETRKVSLAYGYELEGTPNHRIQVLSTDGNIRFTTLNDLKIGDTMVMYAGQQVFGAANQALSSATQVTNPNSNHVHIPERMSTDLAYILGCITSEGTFTPNSISVTNGDRNLLDRLGKLFQQVFEIEHYHITQDMRRESVYTLQINSRVLVRWMLNDIGMYHGARNKTIPTCILRGDRHEIAAFLRGLMLDGYMTADGRMFGIGLANRKMLRQLQTLFLNFGVVSRLHKAGPHAWAVTVAGSMLEKLAAFVEFDELWKNDRISTRHDGRKQRLHTYAELMPRLLTASLRNMQAQSKHSLLGLYGEQTKDYQRARVNLLQNHRMDRELAHELYQHFSDASDAYAQAFFDNDQSTCVYVEVEAIQSGFSEVYDLSVPGSHTFIANGIGNHNTCNFPAGATVEDVKQAYLLGWKLGCKGLTVYVTGSRDKVVLETHATAKAKEGKPEEAQPAAIEAAPEVAVTATQLTVESKHDAVAPLPRMYPTENNKRERPRRLVGQTFRVGTPLGATYITVNENGDGKGQPFEVFIHTAKAGSETAAIAEAIGRLISLVLRMKSPLEPRLRLKEIIDQLEGIGGGRATGFGPARVRSLPDGVSQALQEYIEVSEVDVFDNPTPVIFDPPAAHMHGNGVTVSSPATSSTAAEVKKAVKAGVISGDLCPECGEASVVNEEGCRKCYSCGYSEC